MRTSTTYQCIESFGDALKRAGLEERRTDISPGVTAHRLRPLIQARSGAGPREPKRLARRRLSLRFWILILAFALGLAPALVVGGFALVAKSRGMHETPCTSRMAAAVPYVVPVA